uniref:2'-phosphotransferase n=1 Tax=Albugo laibachii Nc14 TaxID=890382 RepID=F0WQZ2_9STRA|nr:unnamed protein product putative [Albugo laibachii Nc14]|eukprot:CCA23752.1 unnamed protein product putative [Albugo laibachii Nc14]
MAQSSKRSTTAKDVRLSKKLSYALRHGALDLKLDMTTDGYVDTSHLLAKSMFASYTISDIERVVETNDKKRYEMRRDGEGKFIRATQGHSLKIVNDEHLLALVSDANEIEHCIHGTLEQNWTQIENSGLSSMKRNHIHFTTQEFGAQVISGMKQTSELMVYINIRQAMQHGIKFYRSSNNVLLTRGINDSGTLPVRYVTHVTRINDGAIIYRQKQI